VIVDPDTLHFEALENGGQTASGGAGIATAQLVLDRGVHTVLTGNCGPNAYRTLEAAGIEVVTGVSGNVRDAVQFYKKGLFPAASGPTVSAHHGMVGSAAMQGGTLAPEGDGEAAGGSPQELTALKSRFGTLEQRLGDVKRRLDELEMR
jgi:predicted Fe-Mo cluster-binding NifX family protein